MSQTQVQPEFIAGALVPIGGIIMWSGSVATIPSSWALCNGANGTPNLQDRFLVGAGSGYAVGATGGSANATLVSHSHTGTTDNDSPDHTHSITDKEHDHSFTLTQGGANNGSLPGGGNTTRGTVVTGKAFTGITGTLKQDNNHQHTFGTSVEGLTPTTNTANLPPYYALAFIMRVS